MRSTLFYIPHAIPNNAEGWPLFGFGLLLGLLIAIFCGWSVWLLLISKRGFGDVLAGLPFWLLTAAVFVFVLPNVEQTWPDGTPIGLPIRGYGVMVLLGLLSGIAISVYRGSQLGIASDTIVGLGFWMMLGGVLGARIFYVVQKWDEFSANIGDIFRLTEGGLVIYGGVIGGSVAGAIFCYRNKLNVAATADLATPGFFIGLAFGRIGCLLHGCCFGGVCHDDLPEIQFPRGSVPYQAQLASGELLGVKLDRRNFPARVQELDPNSSAAKAGLQVGDQVNRIRIQAITSESTEDPTQPPQLVAEVELAQGSLRRILFAPEDLPASSLPTHPSQIYAAINALLLCGLIWLLQPFPWRDGMAFLTAILLYAISRFLEEGIRSDEAGQLGTPFTISQLVSMGSAALAVVGLVALCRLPPKRVWDWSA